MAGRTTKVKPLVDCKKCVWGGGVVSNFMIDCFNKVRNPYGFKVAYGANGRPCDYYKEKQP